MTKKYLGTYFGHAVKFLMSLPKEEMRKMIQNLFYKFDEDLPKLYGSQLNSGSTVTGVLVNSTTIVVINVGDSQTLLLKDGDIVFKSILHKPTDDIEAARIVAAGGWVGGWDIPRVNGILALSRALGDYHLKEATEGKNGNSVGVREQPVIPEPSVSFFSVRKNFDTVSLST